MILRTVLDSPGITAGELASCLGKGVDLVEGNLRLLCEEGFLVVRGKRFFVA